jgi:lipopolysaccharide biosynthesis glycosyltransferase
MDDETQSYPSPPIDWRSDVASQNVGFVLGASGPKYTALANQAAASVKALHPNIPVDLYTDQDVNLDVYDKVHKLEKTWFRPKFEAIIRSRFDRTVYLDADLVVIADVSDLFWVLNKYDMAAAHVQSRNAGFAQKTWRAKMPNAFPQINGGVMAIKRNDRTQNLMKTVEAAMNEFDLKQDQAVIRELIWLSDVSLYILPSEYNVRSSVHVVGPSPSSAAPRILHNTKFHKRMTGLTPPTPRAVYGAWNLKKVRYRLRTDKQLCPNPIKPGLLNFLKS